MNHEIRTSSARHSNFARDLIPDPFAASEIARLVEWQARSAAIPQRTCAACGGRADVSPGRQHDVLRPMFRCYPPTPAPGSPRVEKFAPSPLILNGRNRQKGKEARYRIAASFAACNRRLQCALFVSMRAGRSEPLRWVGPRLGRQPLRYDHKRGRLRLGLGL